MKYEKAKVTIINLGDQDILTCSGEIAHNWCQPSCTPTYNYGYSKPKKNYGFMGFLGWFRWWF